LLRDCVGINNKERLKELIKSCASESHLPFSITVPDVTFKKIKGKDDFIRKVKTILGLKIEDMKYSLKPVKGVIFYGPPGTGKTFTTKAIANQVGAYFIEISSSSIYSKWFGESEQNMREVFTLARELSNPREAHNTRFDENDKDDLKVIIFIDEIDSLAPKRTDDSSRAARGVVSIMLSELDGFKELKGVTVIGTTNEIDLIDRALLRPGRFEEQVYFPYPDLDTMGEIIVTEFYRLLDEYDINEQVDINMRGVPKLVKSLRDEVYQELGNNNNSMKTFMEATIKGSPNESPLSHADGVGTVKRAFRYWLIEGKLNYNTWEKIITDEIKFIINKNVMEKYSNKMKKKGEDIIFEKFK